MPAVLRTVGVWQVYLDPNSNREYYCNTTTGATVWEPPQEVIAAASQTKAPLWTCGVWQVLRDPSTNREYFCNTAQNTTTWVCPPEIQSSWAQAQAGTQKQQSSGGRAPYASQPPWDIFFDASTSRSYFYNTSTGATTWECPPAVRHLVNATGASSATTVSGDGGPLYLTVQRQQQAAPKHIRLEGTYQMKIGKKFLSRYVKLKEGDLTLWEAKENVGKPEIISVVDAIAETLPDGSGVVISRNGKPLTQVQIERKEDEELWLKVLQANGCNDICALLKEGSLEVKGAKKPRRITLHADRICCYKLAPKPDSFLLLTNNTDIVCASPMEFELKDHNGLAKGKPGAVTFVTESMEQRDEWVAAVEMVVKGLLSGVFGGQLAKGILTSEHVVPTVIYHSLTYLKQFGLKTEGIFRVPGSNSRIQDLRKEYNEYRIPTMNAGDVHNVAGLVKLYFRELYEPLVPLVTREHMIRLNIKNGQDMDKKLIKFKALLDQLPPATHITLNYMLHFLTLVAANSAENKMAADNCGMVFAPGLMKNKELEAQTNQMKMSEDMAQCEACIQLMIVKYAVFFPAGPPYL